MPKADLTLLLPGVAMLFSSCNALHWREQAVAQAEGKIRDEVNDQNAHFSRVQVTGNSNTGQTCGFVTISDGKRGRFVVYIDNTAGPFVENGMGSQYIAQAAFDQAWQGDCVNEGYQS